MAIKRNRKLTKEQLREGSVSTSTLTDGTHSSVRSSKSAEEFMASLGSLAGEHKGAVLCIDRSRHSSLTRVYRYHRLGPGDHSG